jgi:hypothetical protein
LSTCGSSGASASARRSAFSASRQRPAARAVGLEKVAVPGKRLGGALLGEEQVGVTGTVDRAGVVGLRQPPRQLERGGGAVVAGEQLDAPAGGDVGERAGGGDGVQLDTRTGRVGAARELVGQDEVRALQRRIGDQRGTRERDGGGAGVARVEILGDAQEEARDAPGQAR